MTFTDSVFTLERDEHRNGCILIIIRVDALVRRLSPESQLFLYSSLIHSWVDSEATVSIAILLVVDPTLKVVAVQLLFHLLLR